MSMCYCIFSAETKDGKNEMAWMYEGIMERSVSALQT